ncbi:MAG: transporter substrate-binding domain-containing protein [Anaerolineae bacterium]
MIRHATLLLTSLLLLSSLLVGSVASQEATPEATPAVQSSAADEALLVGVRVIPPFVMEGAGGFRGFSIDLWREIAGRLGIDYMFASWPNVRELLGAVEHGDADVGIAAISITEQREETLDFSVPMFRAGLQILAPVSANLSVVGTINSLLRPSILQFVLFAALFVIFIALLIWVVERLIAKRQMRKPPTLGETLYDTATSFLQEDRVGERGRSGFGRVLTLFWLCIAVMFGIMLEGIVTAHLTVEQLNSQVQSLSDLYDKRVYTVDGSTSYDYLVNAGIYPTTVESIDEAFGLLMSGQADAIVYDAPVLDYLAATRGNGRVQTVGEPFRLEYYGIALPQSSPLKERIDRTLLAIMEDGTYERMLKEWFPN